MKPLLLTLNLLCGADAATTHKVIANGGHEVLWPTQNPYVIDSIEAIQAAAFTVALRDKTGRRAKITAWVAIGIRGAIVANNINQLHRR